jgi:phage baseplate assembly protein W
MDIAFPYSVGSNNRTSTAGLDDHIRQLIEQVLFTSPGERVNRPTFGCGLLRLVFEPAGDGLASTLNLAVSGALQQWLAALIFVQNVSVTAVDSTVTVTVRYLVRRTMQQKTTEFTRVVG